MSFYNLPKIQFNNGLIKSIEPIFSNNDSIFINKTLSNYLNKIKTEIETCGSEWDRYKKYTNPYEYIHSGLPHQRFSICKYKPLSRSFYKLIEICKSLSLLSNLNENACKTYHIAEGPGGFIEAISHMRSNKTDKYYGISLIDDEETVPGWKKSRQFLNDNSNVIIETGIDKRGDIMNNENLMDCYDRHTGSMDFITADGGFDFSIDFNKQENVSGKLILSQIAFAVAMLKPTKDFVIKFFDTFTKLSIELLFLLSNIFTEITIIKPNTSRCANSEKYVVCKHLKINEIERHRLVLKFNEIIKKFKNDSDILLTGILNILIPHYFVIKIEEINAILGQQQIENIISTLTLINSHDQEKIDKFKKNNIVKCIKWCQRFDLPFNKHSYFEGT